MAPGVENLGLWTNRSPTKRGSGHTAALSALADPKGGAILMNSKVLKLTVFLQIFALILILGLFAQLFIGQKIHLQDNSIILREIFQTKVDFKDILGITERISSKSGSRFYFIDTRQGSYEVDDQAFLSKQGKIVIEKLGLREFPSCYSNIRRVYCAPKELIDFRNSIKTEEISYNFTNVKRTVTPDTIFSDIYIALLLTVCSLYLMVPSGYCYLHPEFHRDFYPRYYSAEKALSERGAKIFSLWLCMVGAGLMLLAAWILFKSFG